MNAIEYKKALHDDLEQLKNNSIDMLPQKNFYLYLFRIWGSFYLYVALIPYLLSVVVLEARFTLTDYYNEFILLSLICGVVSLFFLPAMAQYITFHEAIKPHLKLGSLIDGKLRCYARIFIAISVLWSIAYITFFFSANGLLISQLMFLVMPGVVMGAFIASILAQIDLARIGLNTLFEVIAHIKHTSKENDEMGR